MEKGTLEKMRDLVKVQEQSGNWDYDAYMHGMYNGMELMLAIAEGREPNYKRAPEQWICNKTIENEEPIEAGLQGGVM